MWVLTAGRIPPPSPSPPPLPSYAAQSEKTSEMQSTFRPAVGNIKGTCSTYSRTVYTRVTPLFLEGGESACDAYGKAHLKGHCYEVFLD